MTDPTPYTEPQPYTAAELAEIRRVAPSVPGLDGGDLLRRLLATLDDIVLDADRQRESYMAADARARQAEAERDAARADRVCWRETHNQVAAERDALAVELRNLASETAKVLLTVKPNLDRAYPDDPRWTPWTRWVEKKLDPLIRRALDASPTEGNPDDD